MVTTKFTIESTGKLLKSWIHHIFIYLYIEEFLNIFKVQISVYYKHNNWLILFQICKVCILKDDNEKLEIH